MPIITDFKLPASAKSIPLPEGPHSMLFIAFVSSDDPATGQPWCPDVRAALPHIKAAFAAEETPPVGLVTVGQKPEWKDPDNLYRKTWNVSGIPTLARYQRVNGEVTETGKVTEVEILDSAKFKAFLGDWAKERL
ncbi:DUF953 domain protein [Penicillium chermesinum]|uniref:DUF953 domain protein n=1 Tax=Penicillium chermesinum TaxID=63820 RepID=A0A9W9NCD3_9EURO|nr:DUF953 domain protein [Penicillium chermesinum]KAJ5217267.1 DUF953 domain protein [Penicillium chermesinum]